MNETREVRVSAAKETRDMCSVVERDAGLDEAVTCRV